VTVDVEATRVTAGNVGVPFEMAEGVRRSFIEGRWDTTAELLANQAAILEASKRLPYMTGFRP
jgi:hypothetical protein